MERLKMIKGLITHPKIDTPAIFLGLSRINVNRMIEGLPIKFNLKEIGLNDITLIIHYGTTEEEILKDLIKHGIDLR